MDIIAPAMKATTHQPYANRVYRFNLIGTWDVLFFSQNRHIKIVSTSITESAEYPINPCTVIGIFPEPAIIKAVEEMSNIIPAVKKTIMDFVIMRFRCSEITPME